MQDAAALHKLVVDEQLDAICLQETKLQCAHIEDMAAAAGLQDWTIVWNCATAKKGYAGTATLCRQEPISSSCGISVPEHDQEGRVVTVVSHDDTWLDLKYSARMLFGP